MGFTAWRPWRMEVRFRKTRIWFAFYVYFMLYRSNISKSVVHAKHLDPSTFFYRVKWDILKTRNCTKMMERPRAYEMWLSCDLNIHCGLGLN
jgi:hypothetical protein